MDHFRLERIPLPRFSTYVVYTLISICGSVLRLCYLFCFEESAVLINGTSITQSLLHYSLDDTWLFWSFINFAYCLLICVGCELQRIFFGELRDSENLHIREKFSNFIFYKVIFVYGILNVEALHELLLWTSWFSVVGFLHLFAGLIKDRSEFIMQSSDAPFLQTSMVWLLCALLFLDNVLMIIAVVVGTRYSLHLMFFMLAEVFQLAVRTLHVIVWYAVQLYSEAIANNTKLDELYPKSVSLYYTEVLFSSTADLGDVVHHLHLLFWNGIRVNMSIIVIGMHLQRIYYKLANRYGHHRRYRRVMSILHSRCLRVNVPDQNCAICWVNLMAAVQLPCGHLFHMACLHMWIERSANCPTCRNPFDRAADSIRTVSSPFDHSFAIATDSRENYSLLASTRQPDGSCATWTSHDPPSAVTDASSQSLTKQSGASTCSMPSPYENVISNPFLSLRNPHMPSALANTNSFLNFSDELVDASEEGDIDRSRTSSLWADFLDALETELVHYFRPVECSGHAPSSFSSTSDQRLGHVSTGLPSSHHDHITPNQSKLQRLLNATESSAHASCSFADQTDKTPPVSPLDSDLICIGDNDDFPPKRVLRLAIRHLLHRVVNAVRSTRLVNTSSKCEYMGTNRRMHCSSELASSFCPPEYVLSSEIDSILDPWVRISSNMDTSIQSMSQFRWSSTTGTTGLSNSSVSRSDGVDCRDAKFPSHKSFASAFPSLTQEQRSCLLEKRKLWLIERAKSEFLKNHPAAY